MRRLAFIGAVAAALMGFMVGSPVWAVPPAAQTVLVTPSDLVSSSPGPGQFVVIDQHGGSGGGVSMVNGPATPPLGVGSLQMSVTASSDHWSVYNYDHIGTALSDITALSYSTYTDNTTTAPVLQMEINPGNTSGVDAGVHYSTLNFEPYMNPGEQALAAGTWQSWDVLAGKVWGTHLTGAPQGAPITWSAFLSTYPNAQISGGFGVNVGSGWAAMTSDTDALRIGTASGTTTYNFEPTARTTTVVTSSADPPASGQLVTFTATVTPSSGPGVPTGTVSFSDTTGAISGCSAQPLDGSGMATCTTLVPYTTSNTPDAITAHYSGNQSYAPSTGTYDESAALVCLTGRHVGTVEVSGPACISDATLTGRLMVHGGSVVITDSSLTGPVAVVGAAARPDGVSVEICNSHLTGPLTVTGAAGSVILGGSAGCGSNTVIGPVTLSHNAGGVQVGGNLVIGRVSCSDNSPAPTNNGSPNAVLGPETGQCRGL